MYIYIYTPGRNGGLAREAPSVCSRYQPAGADIYTYIYINIYTFIHIYELFKNIYMYTHLVEMEVERAKHRRLALGVGQEEQLVSERLQEDENDTDEQALVSL